MVIAIHGVLLNVTVQICGEMLVAELQGPLPLTEKRSVTVPQPFAVIVDGGIATKLLAGIVAFVSTCIVLTLPSVLVMVS